MAEEGKILTDLSWPPTYSSCVLESLNLLQIQRLSSKRSNLGIKPGKIFIGIRAGLRCRRWRSSVGRTPVDNQRVANSMLESGIFSLCP